MDWPRRDPAFLEADLNTVWIYKPQPNKAIWRGFGREDIIEYELDSRSEKLSTVSDWAGKTSSDICDPGLAVLLASRCNQGGKVTVPHNPANLEYIPFTSQDFFKITELLPLHGDTTRAINRNDVPCFMDIVAGPEKGMSETRIYYCCRTSGAWAGDMAVSAVFYPETGFTAAVVFGCSDKISDDIAGRIENSEDACAHPMLIIGIIAEIEKERHVKLVNDKLFHLLRRVRTLSKSETVSSTSSISKDNYSIELWIEVSRIRIALNMWKQELRKMGDHIMRLHKDLLKPPPNDKTIKNRAVYASEAFQDEDSIGDHSSDVEKRDLNGIRNARENAGSTYEQSWRVSARQTGQRIRRRLKDIELEYDQKIQECTMVLDGMALSAQLSWSQIGYQDTQTNLKIANDTKQESSQMRSIALLTMVFLPATFISSLFSTTFFNWNASDGENVISPWIALYFVLVVVTTAGVMLSWHLYMKHRIARVSSEEKGERGCSQDKDWWDSV